MPVKRPNLSLVTGGSGLLGSRLLRRLLSDGQKVRVLDTRYGELDDLKTHPRLEFVGIGTSDSHGGMADKRIVEKAIKDATVVYHLAINWDGHTWKKTLPLPDLFDVNIRGTLNLLETAQSCKVRHCLFSSSAAVYGETQRTISLKHRASRQGIVDEESVCKPWLWDGDPGPAYAIVKLAMENLCLAYFHQHGLPVTVFRIEYIFVDREQFDDGANIHIDDAVQAFMLSTLNKKTYGQVFNLAYPVPYISTNKIRRTLGWEPQRTEKFLRKIAQG